MTPPRRWSERVIEGLIHASAGVAIIGLLLIFVFIGKEAIPLFTSAEARSEAGLDKMFLAQVPEPDEPPGHMWQPVSDLPKYSLWPLIIGTLKVTLVALVFAFPLALGAAIFT